MRENKQFCATILADLSKAFNCIPYELLIAKLNAYGFVQEALKLIHNYLCDRSQKLKVGTSFSKLLDSLCGVPQWAILRPLLVNIDTFLFFFFIDVSLDITNIPHTIMR